jgi:hypothetical protein
MVDLLERHGAGERRVLISAPTTPMMMLPSQPGRVRSGVRRMTLALPMHSKEKR